MDPFSIAEAGASIATSVLPYVTGHEHYGPGGLTYTEEAALLASNQAEYDQLTGQAVFQRPADHGSSEDVSALKGLVAQWLDDPSYLNSDWDTMREKGVVDLAIQKQEAAIAGLQSGSGASAGSSSGLLLLLLAGVVIVVVMWRKA